MPAPKGNTYHLNNEYFFNPKKFETSEDVANSFVEYLTHLKENPLKRHEAIKSGDMIGTTMEVQIDRVPTLAGFCAFVGMSEQTFLNYTNKEGYEAFFEVSKKIRTNIKANQLDMSLVNLANHNIVARLQGLTDKKELEVTEFPKFIIKKDESE